jgi:S1-C subfamily serine protease
MWRYALALPLLVCLLGAAPPVPGPKAAVKPMVKRGYVGVQIGYQGTDVVVQMVIAGGPAHEADVRPGDVIVSVHGVRPATVQAMVKVIQGLKPGQKVKFVVKRKGRERELEVKVGEL